MNCASEVQTLHKVFAVSPHARLPVLSPVTVQFSLRGNLLLVHFEVKTREIFASRVLGPDEYPYQKDVVEVFVSVSGDATHTPYYEFELSPEENTFQVQITAENGKLKFKEGVNLGLIPHVTEHAPGQGWAGDMTIPLDNLGWDGDPAKIIGNAYSILGKPHPKRDFSSLFMPEETKANFHKPEFFKPLVNCSTTAP
jgi:hypothetical protein